MATFHVSNGFHNSSSTTVRGILLTGQLVPTTAIIAPGDWLIFEKGELLVVEVQVIQFGLGQVALKIDPASSDQLALDGVALYSLYGTEAVIKRP